MNDQGVGQRLVQAMELAGIASVSKLARRTGIDRGYLYRLANGDIRNPHKHLEDLAKATGVGSAWLGTGKGGPYDHERRQDQPLVHRLPVMETSVTVIPVHGEPYEVRGFVPDLFSNEHHQLQDAGLYEFYYVPEMIESFPGLTLLTVETALRPGPGLFLAWKTDNNIKRLYSFTCTYAGLEVVSTRAPDMEVIGRVRNMDYWKLDLSPS
ncbi:helix-turn-helix domain-containing protein [Endozoicomonas acroporae]|uniref:helix-turn-helix domain-containing protein n=1 Tax=Endozoicomonas acroporae TaxID=1701104 RepID=UPI000C77650B|nr:helix-turn-helix transcriptional regulator [Endozoicomonas acroporae]